MTDVLVAAVRAYVDPIELEADLLDELGHDFIAATFHLSRQPDGTPTVDVVDVERRPTDPRGRPTGATNAPLTQFVGVQARADGPGRATVELVGHPGTSHACVRVWVATLPLAESCGTQGPIVTVKLDELHPLSRSTNQGDMP